MIVRTKDGYTLKDDEPVNGRYVFDESGKPICGAHKRRKGIERCKGAPMHGSPRCRHHNGKALKGVEHPRFKTGRYSKYVPRGLDDDYRDALADQDLFNMRDQYALLDGYLRGAISRSATGESGLAWKRLYKEWSIFQDAQKMGDVAAMREQVVIIDDLIRGGRNEALAREEIGRIIDQQRRISESEQKRQIAMQQMVSKTQLKTVMERIAQIIKENVQDKHVLALIYREIQLTFEGDPNADRIEALNSGSDNSEDYIEHPEHPEGRYVIEV